jgi:hypothetical protein
VVITGCDKVISYYLNEKANYRNPPFFATHPFQSLFMFNLLRPLQGGDDPSDFHFDGRGYIPSREGPQGNAPEQRPKGVGSKFRIQGS